MFPSGRLYWRGVLSFFSPCVLPVVPGYLGYLSGLNDRAGGQQQASATKRFRLVVASVFFVCGFVSVFMLIGLSSSFLGSVLARNMTWLQQVAGVAILLLGVHFLGLLPVQFLNRDLRFMPNFKSGGVVSAYLVGLAFGFGWTPCVGPVLASIFWCWRRRQMAASGWGCCWPTGWGSVCLLLWWPYSQMCLCAVSAT